MNKKNEKDKAVILNGKCVISSKANNNPNYTLLQNDQYSINISKDNKNQRIMITVKNLDIHNLTYYQNSYSLKELILKSKPFKLCDSVDEAHDIFIDIIKRKKMFMLIDENDKFFFVIKVSYPGGQEQNVEFNLMKKNISKDEYISILLAKIEKLEKENYNLRSENKLKNTEIKFLKGTLNTAATTTTMEDKNKFSDYEMKLNLTEKNITPNKRQTSSKSLCSRTYNNSLKKEIKGIYNYFYKPKIGDNDLQSSSKKKHKSSYPSDLFKASSSNTLINLQEKNDNDQKQLTYTNFNRNNKKLKENLKKNDMKLLKNNSHPKNKKEKEQEPTNIIYIKNETGKPTMVFVEEYISINQIKARYCKKKSLTTDRKEIYYKGKKLAENKTLEFYKIPWESTLQIFSVPAKIKVYIRCLSGKEIMFIAEETKTILGIKYIIEEREDIPVDKQIVLMYNKILDDNRTLKDYNIDGVNSIHLLVRRLDR